MDDKQNIIEVITPLAVLKPLTHEALHSVPQGQLAGEYICIRKLPFRIGRESRVKKIKGRLERIERSKLGDKEPNNDLYLIDEGRFLNISREHLQLEREGEGFLLRDRKSACGTRLGELHIGGEDAGGSHPLKDGDVIAVGAKATPYLFQFISLAEFEIKQRTIS